MIRKGIPGSPTRGIPSVAIVSVIPWRNGLDFWVLERDREEITLEEAQHDRGISCVLHDSSAGHRPSLEILPNRGITAVSSCIMIDALMYGITPRENTAQFSSAPPLKILKRAATDPPTGC
jgi:hypothetical protein